jgi:hypothetical protein
MEPHRKSAGQLDFTVVLACAASVWEPAHAHSPAATTQSFQIPNSQPEVRIKSIMAIATSMFRR